MYSPVTGRSYNTWVTNTVAQNGRVYLLASPITIVIVDSS